MAGCSRTSVQNALRAAKVLGLISVTERRHKGRPSEFNVIKIISLEWQGWLKLGGSAQGGRVQKFEHDQYKGLKQEEYLHVASRTASNRSNLNTFRRPNT